MSDVNNILQKRALVYYTLVIAILIYRYFTHTLFHHFYGVSMFSLEADNTYWLLQLSGINSFIAGKLSILCFLDLLLFLLPLLSLVFYQKTNVFSITFAVLITYYMLFVNTYAIHHFHLMTGVVFMGIVFCFRKEKNTEYAWQFIRYYYLFLMCSAALWKIGRMPEWQQDNMLHIFKRQHAQFFLENAHSFFSSVYFSLIEYPSLLSLLMYAGIGLELIFAIGFFTKKMDKILFVIGILFFATNYFLMNIAFFELLIFSIVLLPQLALHKENSR